MVQGTRLKVLGFSKGSGLFDKDLRPRRWILVAVVLSAVIWGAGISLASYVDGTLYLPNGGKGIVDHYGFQASFLAGPLVVTTTYFAVSYFLRCLRDLHDLIDPQADRREVMRIVRPHIRSLYLRSPWRNILWLFIFIGVALSVLSSSHLSSPSSFWGNDVFNAMNYRYGFIAANSFLFFLWGLIYPFGVFYAIHLTLSAEIIVARLKRRHYLKLNFLHPDKCGGMSRFGMLNLLVMMIYFWPACAVYALHVTHRYTYSSLVIGAVLVTAAFVLQSIYGIYWISRSIRSEREATVIALNERIATSFNDKHENFSAALAIMQYRENVLNVASFPYSSKVLIAVNLLRTAPATLTLANAIFAYFHVMR